MRIEKLWKKVWDFREENKEKWFAPPSEQCLLYAISELGEYYDALVWRMRPDDARAHLKERVPEIELADTMIMLISIFPAKEMFIGDIPAATVKSPIDAMRNMVTAQSMVEGRFEYNAWKHYAFAALRCIITYLGTDKAEELIDEKLAKIKKKVLGG